MEEQLSGAGPEARPDAAGAATEFERMDAAMHLAGHAVASVVAGFSWDWAGQVDYANRICPWGTGAALPDAAWPESFDMAVVVAAGAAVPFVQEIEWEFTCSDLPREGLAGVLAAALDAAAKGGHQELVLAKAIGERAGADWRHIRCRTAEILLENNLAVPEIGDDLAEARIESLDPDDCEAAVVALARFAAEMRREAAEIKREIAEDTDPDAA